MISKFTEIFPEDLTYEKKSRIQKAKKIQAIINDYLGDTKKLICLDLGCSVGIITSFLGNHFKKIIGVDVDNLAVEKAKKTNRKNNIRFMVSKENQIPMISNSIDVVIFNQIYEHVENPKIVMDEIRRVLKKGGVCFFGARNKLGIFDGHYKLPFISWLPSVIADVYIQKTTLKKKYDIKLYSYWQLTKLVKHFNIVDFTLKAIRNPSKFCATDTIPTKYGVNNLLFVISKVLYVFIPNYLWILEKK